MSKYRVFQNPDGSVRILRPNLRRHDPSRESLAAFCQRVLDQDVQKNPTLAGLPFVDVDDTEIPIDRSQRHKWRVKTRAGKDVVEVDPAVVDPPHPRQPLIDQINSANTVGELKAALLKVVKP